jgi:hypothetical protein
MGSPTANYLKVLAAAAKLVATETRFIATSHNHPVTMCLLARRMLFSRKRKGGPSPAPPDTPNARGQKCAPAS